MWVGLNSSYWSLSGRSRLPSDRRLVLKMDFLAQRPMLNTETDGPDRSLSATLLINGEAISRKVANEHARRQDQ